MDASQLEGADLEWEFRRCASLLEDFDSKQDWMAYAEANEGVSAAPVGWGELGPIIERECIDLIECDGLWAAGQCLVRWRAENGEGHFGPTPLIAAMRAFVASKL